MFGNKISFSCQSNLSFCGDDEEEIRPKTYRGLPQASHGINPANRILYVLYFHVWKAIRRINFAYSILHMWTYNQSSPRVEWLSQLEQITQWLPRSVVLKTAPAWSLCSKNMASASRLVHFRRQLRNISSILVISTSTSANSHLGKSYLCFKSEHWRRNVQHFYTQRKSTGS